MTSTVTTPSLKDRLLSAEIGKLETEALSIERLLRGIEEDGWYNRQAALFGVIGSLTAETIYRMFRKWHWLSGELSGIAPLPFHLGVNSPGGSYLDAFSGFDIIDYFKALGHPVTVQNTGMMTTHAAIMMQAADRRIMTPRSRMMIHEADIQARGNTGDIKDRVKFIRQLEEHGWRLLVSRTNGKLSVEELKNRTYRGTIWELTAEEALEFGLIDAIATDMQEMPGRPRHNDLLASDGDSLEVRKQKAEARLCLLQTDLVRLKTLESIEAADEAGQVLLFDEVEPKICTVVQSKLNMLRRRGLTDVEMLLNTPGGDVYSGSGLMDVMEEINQHANLTTTILGYAASMGGFLFQMGKKRRISKNSYFMIHQASTMFGTSSTHAEERQEAMEKMQNRMFSFMSERTGGKISSTELLSKCKEHDWWLTPQELLEAGLADEII